MAICVSNGAAGLVQCYCRQGFTGTKVKFDYQHIIINGHHHEI